jgi:hypothetical protein
MIDHFVFARIIERFLPKLKAQKQISPDQAASCQNIVNCHTPVIIPATTVVAIGIVRNASNRQAVAG